MYATTPRPINTQRVFVHSLLVFLIVNGLLIPAPFYVQYVKAWNEAAQNRLKLQLQREMCNNATQKVFVTSLRGDVCNAHYLSKSVLHLEHAYAWEQSKRNIPQSFVWLFVDLLCGFCICAFNLLFYYLPKKDVMQTI